MEILIFWLELIAVFCIFHNMLHIKLIKSTIRIILSVVVALIWSIYLYISPLDIPGTGIILGIILLLIDEKWYFKLCWGFVSSLSLNIISSMSLYIYCITARINIQKHENYYFYTDIIILPFIIGISFLICNKNKHSNPLRNIPVKGYLLIAIVSLIDLFLSSVSSLLFFDNLNATGRYVLIFAILLMILLSILLLLLFFRLLHFHNLLQQTNKINQKMLYLEEQHYQELQKKNDDLRAFRHDYNYHITVLQRLVSNKNLDELKIYVENLSSMKEQIYFISLNHPVADAIVNYFYENVPKHVQFKVKGKLSEQLFVSDTDLCIILSNLLHNAVEAVHKLPNDQPAQIYLSVYTNMEYMSVHVKNTSQPCPALLSEEMPTSKADTSKHGFGLRNVKKTAKTYHGNLDLQYKDDMFSVSVYLRNIK